MYIVCYCPLSFLSMYRPVCGVPVIIYLVFAQHLIKTYYYYYYYYYYCC